MGTPCLLGVDIGTSGSKGVIFSADGEIKAAELIEHGISMPKPGWAEHDAEEIWWGDFCRLLPRLTAKAKVSPSELAGIGISGLCPALLWVDKNGNCIRPAILYGIDTRASLQIKQINSLFSKEHIFNLLGHSLSSQSILPKLLWLKENEPENLNMAYKILTTSSYIVYKLTGNFVVDYLTASSGGLIDINTSRWATELFDGLQLSTELFPRLGYGAEIAGLVTSEGQRRLKKGNQLLSGPAMLGQALRPVFLPGEQFWFTAAPYLICMFEKPVAHTDYSYVIFLFFSYYFIGGAATLVL